MLRRVDGHVRGCPEQPDTAEHREGSIRQQSVAEIWQRGFDRYRDGAIRKEDPTCSRCADWTRCRGGCHVMRREEAHCIHRLLGGAAPLE